MKPFTTCTAKVIPLPMKDVDTDMIIPAQYLTSISSDGYGENLFIRLRNQDPQFPFNLPRFKDAEILVADSNFGCGSSREHAVWALLGAGIKVVIAKSFADIFFSNSAKNGLLLISLPADKVDRLLKEGEKGDLSLTVSLVNQKISTPWNEEYTFEYDSFRKYCLTQGLDDLDYILSYKEKIDNYWSERETDRTINTASPNLEKRL